MSLIAAYERAQGTPLWQRSAFQLTLASLGYLVIAAAVAFYLLPTGFGLSGMTLLYAQMAVLAVGAVLIVYVIGIVRRGTTQRARLWALAGVLGWVYRADVSDRPWGGAIDEQIERSSRHTMDYLGVDGPGAPFDSAQRVFTVGSGEGATIQMTRAVRIPLRAEVPRLVLRSRSGGGALSVLPRRPRAGAELKLEGNFSDVFEVSVPSGYETDALYLLTPDLMAVLLDNVGDLDLEVVDDTLHVYMAPVDLADPEHLSRLITVVEVLSERFGRRTELYRDEKAPPLDPAVYRSTGDTLSAAARSVPLRIRVAPIFAMVLAPLVPLALGLAWTHLAA